MSSMYSNYDIRGQLGDSLSVEQIWNLGKALAEWLPEEGPVVLGRSAGADQTAVKAVSEGLRLQGRDVIDAGAGSAATVTQVLSAQLAAGGVFVGDEPHAQLTILELFQDGARRIEADSGLTDVTALAESANFVPAPIKGALRPADQ